MQLLKNSKSEGKARVNQAFISTGGSNSTCHNVSLCKTGTHLAHDDNE